MSAQKTAEPTEAVMQGVEHHEGLWWVRGGGEWDVGSDDGAAWVGRAGGG